MTGIINELQRWHLTLPLTGNVYIFGRTDSGKSWKLLAITQVLHDGYNHKVFDFFGGKRNEGPFWCFMSEELKLWKEYELAFGPMEKEGPKEYFVILARPLFSTKLPTKLEEDLPRIKSIEFGLNVMNISISDISLRIGDVSRKAQNVWNEIQKEVGATGNGEDIQYLMDTKLKGCKSLSIYTLFIKPLIDNHFFVRKDSKYNLNLINEANDIESIFVLCHEYIPEEFKWFIMGNLLRRIGELAMNNKITRRNICLFRECSNFMKVTDKTALFAEQTGIFRNLLTDAARYARSGTFLFMDSQSPEEVKNLIESQDDFTGICEMAGAKDRETLCQQLKIDKRMTRRQISSLYNIKIHEMVVIERAKKARLLRRVMPPRTLAWKPTLGSFANVWKNKINKYKNINEEIKEWEEDYQLSKTRNTIKILKEEPDIPLTEKEIKSVEEERLEEIKRLEEAPIKA